MNEPPRSADHKKTGYAGTVNAIFFYAFQMKGEEKSTRKKCPDLNCLQPCLD